MTPAARWTAEQVREAVKAGRKPVVLRRGEDYRNVSERRAARFEGEFSVQESPHEIIVTDNGRWRSD